jgi:hypothetical protein
MTQDMNKMEHAGSIEEGCKTGKHDFDIKELGIKGKETQLGARCRSCGKVQVFDVELGINDLIISDEEVAEFKRQQEEAAEEMGVAPGEIPTDAIIASKKAREAKEADSFWDNIKHGEQSNN